MASSLGGVEDKAVYPARGQICIVRNHASAMATTSGTDGGPPDRSDVFYVQPRPEGGTIIGGSYQKNDWSAEFDPDLASRMMERAVKWCPELTSGEGPEKLDVIKHTVGLRPCREGGTRVEKELIGGVWVVHNYGHGGFGCMLFSIPCRWR
jgi:D-amino-acid oxidase